MKLSITDIINQLETVKALKCIPECYEPAVTEAIKLIDALYQITTGWKEDDEKRA